VDPFFLLFQSFGLPIGFGFLLPDVELRDWCRVMQRPFASTLSWFSYHSLSCTMATVAALARPTYAEGKKKDYSI